MLAKGLATWLMVPRLRPAQPKPRQKQPARPKPKRWVRRTALRSREQQPRPLPKPQLKEQPTRRQERHLPWPQLKLQPREQRTDPSSQPDALDERCRTDRARSCRAS